MYQVGRAEHIDLSDERFDTETEAIAHAQRESADDQVWTVWNGQTKIGPMSFALSIRILSTNRSHRSTVLLAIYRSNRT